MEQKWYQQKWVIIASLWLFFPAGLYLMWRYASWSGRWKWGITGIAAALVALTALGAALPTEDPLAGLTPEQVVSVHATATQEALAAQEEDARQEEIAAQEEQERAYLEALAKQEEQKEPPASEPITDTPEVQEQDEITQQIAALYPEAYPDWVQCARTMYDEGDKLVNQETIEICGQPEAWKSFVSLAAEQFPQESSTWIDCAAYNVFSTLTEAELQSYNEEDEFKALVQMTAHLVCDPPVDPLQAVQELKALLHNALSSVREGCRATSIGDSAIPNSCRPTLDTAATNLKAETEEGLPGVCLDLIKQRFYVIRTLEELGPVVDAAALGNPEALIFLGITLYSEDAGEGGFAALDARIAEIEC